MKPHQAILAIPAIGGLLSGTVLADTVVNFGEPGGSEMVDANANPASVPTSYSTTSYLSPADETNGYDTSVAGQTREYYGATDGSIFGLNNNGGDGGKDAIQMVRNFGGAGGTVTSMIAWKADDFLTSDRALESFNMELETRGGASKARYLIETADGWYQSQEFTDDDWTPISKNVGDLTWSSYSSFGVSGGGATPADTDNVLSVGAYFTSTLASGNWTGAKLRYFNATAGSAVPGRTWDGSDDMTWTNPDSTSWSGDTYTDGNNATFGDTGAGTVTISGTVAPGRVTVDSASDYTFSGDAIGGTGGLTHSGVGRLTLSNANTFTGDTTVTQGTLEIEGAGSLGSGSYAGAIANNWTFDYNSSSDQTLGGIISGSGALVKDQASILTLTGANAYTGDTSVWAGTLEIGGSGKLGSYPGALSISSGAVFKYSSDQTASASNRFTGDISGDGTFVVDTVTGSVLSRGNISVATIEIKSGKFEGQAKDDAIGNGSTTIHLGDTTGTADAELKISGAARTFTTKAGIVVEGGSSGTKTISSSPGTFSDNTTILLKDNVAIANQGPLTLGGVISESGGSFGLTVNAQDATDTLTLTGTNTYTGATTVSAGTFAITAGSTASPITVNTGAVLELSVDSTITSTSSVTLDAGSTVNVTGAPTLSSYTLITTAGITGTPVLAAPVAGYELVVDGTSLKLNATGGGSYSTWATANGIDGEPASGDFDNDGISNLLEYALGTNPTVSSQPAGVLSGNVITYTKGSDAIANADVSWVIETSETLTDGSWTPQVTQAPGDATATIEYTFTPGTPAKNFARLKVEQN